MKHSDAGGSLVMVAAQVIISGVPKISNFDLLKNMESLVMKEDHFHNLLGIKHIQILEVVWHGTLDVACPLYLPSIGLNNHTFRSLG